MTKTYCYSVSYGTNSQTKGDKMTRPEDLKLQNDKYHTCIYVKDESNSRTKSIVEIECDDFETFSKIVKAVDPILKEEVKK